MGPDDGSDHGDADLVPRKARREQIEELVQIGRFAVAHAQAFHGGLFEQTVSEPPERFFPRARLAGMIMPC